MFKKQFTVICVGFLCFFLLYGSVVFASAESYKSYAALYDEEEYGEVLKAIEQSDTSGEIPKNFYAASRDANTVKYKIYKLSQPDIIVQLNNGKTIADCLSTEYLWTVETPGKLFSVVRDNNEWRTVGYQYLDDEKSRDGVIDTAVFERNDIAFPQTKSAQNSEILFFNAPMYFTNFIYYTLNGTEYLIPYGSRPDLTLLENGKVYTAQEAADILTESFHLNEKRNPNENGGPGGVISSDEERTTDSAPNNDPANNTAFKIAVPVFAVTAAAVILIVIIKSRKRKIG